MSFRRPCNHGKAPAGGAAHPLPGPTRLFGPAVPTRNSCQATKTLRLVSRSAQGEYLGIAATGRQVTSPGVTIVRIAGGKVVDVWRYSDTLGRMRPLGVIPAAGEVGG